MLPSRVEGAVLSTKTRHSDIEAAERPRCSFRTLEWLFARRIARFEAEHLPPNAPSRVELKLGQWLNEVAGALSRKELGERMVLLLQQEYGVWAGLLDVVRGYRLDEVRAEFDHQEVDDIARALEREEFLAREDTRSTMTHEEEKRRYEEEKHLEAGHKLLHYAQMMPVASSCRTISLFHEMCRQIRFCYPCPEQTLRARLCEWTTKHADQSYGECLDLNCPTVLEEYAGLQAYMGTDGDDLAPFFDLY